MVTFIWATEHFKLNLLSNECSSEDTNRIELDRTEIFTYLPFWPVIRIPAGKGDSAAVENRERRVLQLRQT